MIPEISVPTAAQAKEAAKKKLDEVARSFESIFLQMMMQSMRSAVPKSGFLSGGTAEETFVGLFDREVSERASRQGRGFGLAKMIVKEFSKQLRADAGGAMDAKG